MNFADLLSYTDIEQLNRIARQFSSPPDTHSKNRIIQTILLQYSRNPGGLIVPLEELLPEERLFLLLLFLDKREQWTLEELEGKAKLALQFTDNGANSRSLIAQGLNYGWLFRGVTRNTYYLFQIPQDVRNKVLKSFRSFFIPLIVRFEQPPLAYRDDGLSALEDVFHLLRFVEKEEVLITTDGVIYKRQLQQLMKQLVVHEELPEQTGWRFGFGRHFRDYPDRFSLLYDFCYYHRYLSEEEGRLSLSAAGKKILLLEQKPTLLSLYQFWIRLYVRAIPLLSIITHVIGEAAKENWVSCDSLLTAVMPWMKEFYYEDKADLLQKRIIGVMVYLGLLQLAEWEGVEERGVRLTALGEEVLRQARGFAGEPIILM